MPASKQTDICAALQPVLDGGHRWSPPGDLSITLGALRAARVLLDGEPRTLIDEILVILEEESEVIRLGGSPPVRSGITNAKMLRFVQWVNLTCAGDVPRFRSGGKIS